MLVLPPAGPLAQKLVARLAPQVEDCRWQGRFRFFPRTSRFSADTDCTAIATGALYEHGLLSAADLQQGVSELLRAAAPAPADCRVRADGRGDEHSYQHVLMVYWEDGVEPNALPRGRKHDAVACANALYTLHLNHQYIAGDDEAVITASMRYLRDHLVSRRYMHGTRYYPSPDAFLYAASRICARFPQHSRMLTTPLRHAVQEREIDTQTWALADQPGTALDLALRTLAADNLALNVGQDEGRMLLARLQQPDGSWPACPYYRMGRFPVYFGSPCLTTLFARRALRGRRREQS
ncbi:hypothetical protein OG906_40430 (plasmid) [Streptomyces sp. NBC_01426]|uniref:hypothetical protein n=1 Tax=Streptomyces sp. NBC_01426 TaxID=2975866 RepID=UPI002E305D19|nr:hypothetical protein [Streptomyces sp. NBC_01426]